MAPRNKGRDSNSTVNATLDPQHCYEGERLDRLLQSIQRKIESARLMDGDSLPEKIWFKLHFAIGVNEVTRVLERMKPVMTLPVSASGCDHPHSVKAKAPSSELQAVLIASDCNPRWLTRHLPSLALSRNVPLIFLKHNKRASLRLGQLVKLKTAIAIGVKAKGNVFNKLVDEIRSGNGSLDLGGQCVNMAQMLPKAEEGQLQQ